MEEYMDRNERLVIKVSQEEKDALKKYCSGKGISISHYIRSLIEMYLKDGGLDD